MGLAKVVAWGMGGLKREFLYVDDFAAVCAFLIPMENLPALANIDADTDVTTKKESRQKPWWKL